MTTLEHREIKGITVKNIVVTLISTASIVASVVGTYFQIKADLSTLKNTQETTARVNEVRLKLLESQVASLQVQINELKAK
jgi:hypothetical protein